MSKLVVTTSWDDGAVTDLKLAELLEKYDIKGTFYIPQSYMDNPLQKNDIVVLDKKFEVGAHTLTHVDLTTIALEEAEKEIEGSKAYLEDLLGHDIVMFCYPKGRYNENIKKLVRSSGFIAARTCVHGSFSPPEDPYEWQISLHASNGSPLMSLKIWRKSGISIRSLLDWEIRAKMLFDLALEKGGIYHIWGHSWELERKHEWPKLERVLNYLSTREGVQYMTNEEAIAKEVVKHGTKVVNKSL